MSEQGRSIDDILAMAADPAYHRVAVARVPFVPQELRDEHARLDALLPTLVSDTIDAHPQRLETAQRIAEIEAEMELASIEFRFRNIGRRAWADLLRKHPPTKDHLKENRNADYNPETFPHEAIAAACFDPVMTVEQVIQLESSPMMDVRSWTDLWTACLRACVVEQSPKSRAAGLILRQSGGFGTTAVDMESPDPSFSDE